MAGRGVHSRLYERAMSVTVPFLDLRAQYEAHRQALDAAISRVIGSASLHLGSEDERSRPDDPGDGGVEGLTMRLVLGSEVQERYRDRHGPLVKPGMYASSSHLSTRGGAAVMRCLTPSRPATAGLDAVPPILAPDLFGTQTFENPP